MAEKIQTQAMNHDLGERGTVSFKEWSMQAEQESLLDQAAQKVGFPSYNAVVSNRQNSPGWGLGMVHEELKKMEQ